MDTALIDVLPPPPTPGTIYDSEAWSRVEADLGTELPADVKEFNRTYGSGLIGGEIAVHNPSSGGISIVDCHRRTGSGTLEMLQDDGVIGADLAVFPDPGGLLTWAHSQNGDMWFWSTTGLPNEWTVAVVPRFELSQAIYFYDLSMTGYLAAFISGGLSDDFSQDWLVLRNSYETENW